MSEMRITPLGTLFSGLSMEIPGYTAEMLEDLQRERKVYPGVLVRRIIAAYGHGLLQEWNKKEALATREPHPPVRLPLIRTIPEDFQNLNLPPAQLNTVVTNGTINRLQTIELIEGIPVQEIIACATLYYRQLGAAAHLHYNLSVQPIPDFFLRS